MNILLADDHKLFRDGLKKQVKQFKKFSKIYQAKNGQQVLKILKKIKVELVFLSLNMSGMKGISTLKKIVKHKNNIKIIIIAEHYDIKHIKPVLQLNIKVILDKVSIHKELNGAIQAANKNQMYYSFFIKNTINEILNGKKKSHTTIFPQLTNMEKKLLPLFTDGYSNKQIAKKHSLSPYTIEEHRKNIFKKFKVNKIAQLVKKATLYQFIDN